jgi:hypothetical protein
MLAESDSDLGEARAAAERAVFLAPNDPDSHIAVGIVAIADGRTVAFGCALAWQQTRSRFNVRSKVPRRMFWLATAVLVVITQIPFGPLPAVVGSTEILLRVATAFGCVAVVYAICHRRK